MAGGEIGTMIATTDIDVETGWQSSLVGEGTVRLSSKGESDRRFKGDGGIALSATALLKAQLWSVASPSGEQKRDGKVLTIGLDGSAWLMIADSSHRTRFSASRSCLRTAEGGAGGGS